MTSLFDSGIRPVIDDWLLKEAAKERDYGDYWSASSAGKCQRMQIFERLGIPHVKKDSDARKQRVFTAGHLFHDWIQGITKEAGLSIAQELELKDEQLKVIGHIDDLVLVNDVYVIPPPTKETMKITKISKEDWDNAGTIKTPDFANAPKHLILYDYKTRNSKNFDYAKRPSLFHRYQLGTYMLMLKKMAKAELERRAK